MRGVKLGGKRHVKQDYYNLADERRLYWRGTKKPKTSRDKTSWACRVCEHSWESSYAGVKSNKLGCPRCGKACAGRFPKHTVWDYIKLGKEKGYIYVGTASPINSKQKVLWFCLRCLRVFFMRYNDIYNNHGCRHCWKMENGQKTSAPQRTLAGIVNGVINYSVGKLSIDVALPNKKIAIEYDCWFWHAHKQKEDIKRAKRLVALGWRVLRIKTNRLMPNKALILSCLKELEQTDYVELTTADWGTEKPRWGWPNEKPVS